MKIDRSLLMLALLSTSRDQLEAEIDLAIGQARVKGIPATAIAAALGRTSRGHLDESHPRHRVYRDWIAQAQPGDLAVGGRETTDDDRRDF
ncbi:hypothetical protein GCM10022286_00320 [Gryllotalpicola daejeonensis]|uniref:CopG family transcriptional regulator n=1 Tax=Gryllotalpicola daejeonensis TaxID=993087 RepID=A0ABP7ZCS4_9MICO